MKTQVVIKGTKSGIIVILDKESAYEELKEAVAEKFSSSSKFLGDTQVAVAFEGRELTTEEQMEMLGVIRKNSSLDVVCIVENDEKTEEHFKKSLNEKLVELGSNTGQFYKGNLRSGQVLTFETGVIIIGDVNVGAQVVSKGNIVVLGTLKGTAFAGSSGNEKAFVVALEMEPVQIRIGDVIGRSPDKVGKHVGKDAKEPKIAFCEDGNIYIEPLVRDVLSDIQLF